MTEDATSVGSNSSVPKVSEVFGTAPTHKSVSMAEPPSSALPPPIALPQNVPNPTAVSTTTAIPPSTALPPFTAITALPPTTALQPPTSGTINANRGKGIIVAPIIEELPPENKEMIHETYDSYRKAKKRIADLEKRNYKNDQIILLFVASLDSQGKPWHADSIPIERAVSYMIKKLEAGGYFIKIYCGNRSQWQDPENPWKRDPKFNVTILPTIMVCDTMKRIAGRKTFDLESLMVLIRD